MIINNQKKCRKKGACPRNSICINKCDGFECKCKKGFKKEDGKCVPECDENQCERNPYACGKNTECENLCEGYRCKCLDGYVHDEKTLRGCKLIGYGLRKFIIKSLFALLTLEQVTWVM